MCFYNALSELPERSWCKLNVWGGCKKLKVTGKKLKVDRKKLKVAGKKLKVAGKKLKVAGKKLLVNHNNY